MKTIGKAFDLIWNWVIESSANPGQVSLTVKGGLAYVIGLILSVAGATHVQIPDLSENLNALASSIVLFVQVGLQTVGAISAIIGIARKIWLTFFPTAV